MKFDMVIGNPPYGTGANLAIKFLNKSCELSDDVRMVLPASFQRESVQNKIHVGSQLIHDERLPDETFPRDITTVYQRWVKGETARDPHLMFRSHPDFQFLKYEEREKATLFIGGAGAGPSGKVKDKDFMHYAPGHHYVVCNEEIKKRLQDIQTKMITASRVCGCLPGISKHGIIKIYEETYGKQEHAQLSGWE